MKQSPARSGERWALIPERPILSLNVASLLGQVQTTRPDRATERGSVAARLKRASQAREGCNNIKSGHPWPFGGELSNGSALAINHGGYLGLKLDEIELDSVCLGLEL